MTHWGEISCHAEKASESSLLLEPSERIRRLVTRVGIDFDRSAAAYHEAGHAVVGFWYGWVIEPRGVEIDTPTNDAVSLAAPSRTRSKRVLWSPWQVGSPS